MRNLKTFSLFLSLIIMISLAACGGAKKKDKPTSDTTETIKPAKDSLKKETVIAKKDTAKTKKIHFAVLDVTEPAVKPNDFTGADKGKKKLIAVQIWVKNVSKSEHKVAHNEFKVFDQDNVEYTEQTAYADKWQKPAFFNTKVSDTFKLAAGAAASGWLTFITDIKSKPAKFKVKKITVTL